MAAMVLHGHGDFDQLQFHSDWPVPVPVDDQVLIRVEACGLNNTDVNTRVGWYSKSVESATSAGVAASADDDASWGGNPITFPRIQGADVAGVVVSTASTADAALIGKRVLVDTWLRNKADPYSFDGTGYFGSECDGGFAQYTCAPVSNVHPVKSQLSSPELATFATSYVTAENMLNRAVVREGDTVLIPGASGGVGGALIQLAKRRGARTIGMASASKHEQVLATGVDVVLPRSPENLVKTLKDRTGSSSVSVVADAVGGPLWNSLIDCLERGGRYTCSGAIAGPMVKLDLRTLYLRDLTFTGATVVPPGVFADLVHYIDDAEIKPLLAATYPLASLHEAQQVFIDKQHVGNLVVDCQTTG
ncbi:MAG: alcohol dehydrogenase family protein [Gammaproteobacteria bacterium]|nr:alcohol dehydrogenase family protein [Gammaproteobacteria bacterium]